MLVKCFSGTQKWPSFEAAITDQVDDEGEVECNDNGYDEVDVPKRRHLLYVDSYEVHVDGNDSYSQDADYCLHYPESSIINAKYITRLYICAHNTSFWDKFCLGFLWGFFWSREMEKMNWWDMCTNYLLTEISTHHILFFPSMNQIIWYDQS